MAIEKGDILLDVRVLNISPDTDGNQVTAGGAPFSPPAGINYTFFFSEGTTSDLDAALGGNTGIDVDDAFGIVAQAFFSHNHFMSCMLWWLWFF